MKRWSLVVALSAIVAMLVPFSASADPMAPIMMECFGFANSDGATPESHMSRTCSASPEDEEGATISVPAGMRASILHTHANFRSARTGGELTLTWLDDNDAVVQSWRCLGFAANDDYSADVVNFHCLETQTFNANYAPGTHTVRTTVTSALNCPATGPSPAREDGGCFYQGRIFLTDATELV